MAELRLAIAPVARHFVLRSVFRPHNAPSLLSAGSAGRCCGRQGAAVLRRAVRRRACCAAASVRQARSGYVLSPMYLTCLPCSQPMNHSHCCDMAASSGSCSAEANNRMVFDACVSVFLLQHKVEDQQKWSTGMREPMRRAHQS